MKKIVSFTLILLFSISFFSCEKQLDKQIRLEIDGITISPYIKNSLTDWKLINNSDFVLINFNKNNYPKIKSIHFSAALWTDDSTYNCEVELFNLTDSVSIANSIISSNQQWVNQYADYIESENLLNSFPDKTIDVAFRIRSSEVDKKAYLSTRMYLFLYR